MFETRRDARRFLSLLVSASLVMGSRSKSEKASLHITHTDVVVVCTTFAIPARPYFFPQKALSRKWVLLREAASWLLGDPVLKPLRKPYHREMLHYLLFAATAASTALAVAFAGQALCDTAFQGVQVPRSLQMMILFASLTFFLQMLKILSEYIQFLLARMSSGFVASVRTILIRQALADDPGFSNPELLRLGYLHAPSFAVRNIEIPLKIPLIVAQALLGGRLLWQRDPIIMGVAVLTGIGLGFWSHRLSRPLVGANTNLRQAESKAMSSLEQIKLNPSIEVTNETDIHFHHVRDMEVRLARQRFWYDGIVNNVSTLILMSGVMVWGAVHEYVSHKPSTAEIYTLTALAWNVQDSITKFLALVKLRRESESATFLLPKTLAAAA